MASFKCVTCKPTVEFDNVRDLMMHIATSPLHTKKKRSYRNRRRAEKRSLIQKIVLDNGRPVL